MNNIKFDSQIISAKKIDNILYIKCDNPVYEIKINKNGKFYKKCLSNKYRSSEIHKIIKEMEVD